MMEAELQTHNVDDIVELLVEKAKPGSENPGVISHAKDGRVVIFDKDEDLSYRLLQGQLVRGRITKVFEKYYVAAPTVIISPQTSQPNPSLREAAEAVLDLTAADKAYLIGALGLPLDVERLDRTLRQLLRTIPK